MSVSAIGLKNEPVRLVYQSEYIFICIFSTALNNRSHSYDIFRTLHFLFLLSLRKILYTYTVGLCVLSAQIISKPLDHSPHRYNGSLLKCTRNVERV